MQLPLIQQAKHDRQSCPAQAEALQGDLSVVQTLVEAAPDAATSDVKALLGRMMFSGTAMEKKVRPVVCWAEGTILYDTTSIARQKSNNPEISARDEMARPLWAASLVAPWLERRALRSAWELAGQHSNRTIAPQAGVSNVPEVHCSPARGLHAC